MKSLFNRAKYVMTGEDGASNLEAIVWIAVVLLVTVALLLFGGSIKNFVTNATSDVDTLDAGRGDIIIPN